MRTRSLLLAAFAAALTAAGQEPAPPAPQAYRLDFAIHELEGGKRVQTRNFTMLLEEGARGSHRAGTKLPVATSQGSGGFQYQYMDVGVNLDARIARRRGELISLEAGLEISDVQETKTATPAIRAVRSNTWAPIKPGERTLISAFEDSSGKRRYEVEVTAQAVR